MRVKSPKVVVTFATTSDAMAMEAAAREHDVPGRIIPVPSDIDAGCGLAWCVDACEHAALEGALETYGLAHEGIYEVMMY